MNISMSQYIAMTMASVPAYENQIAQPDHPTGVKNGVRPMFKQNKRAEAKRRNK